MKKEFITPMIEIEMLSARDRVMGIFAESEEDTIDDDMGVVTGTRTQENAHWYGSGR